MTNTITMNLHHWLACVKGKITSQKVLTGLKSFYTLAT